MPDKAISAFSSPTEPAAPTGKNYLFVVAIDNYLHCPKLFNAQRDADAIIELLTKNYRFDPENVVLLRNEEATEGGILNAFRDLVRILTPEDNLIIYFSGHGEFDPLLDEGYWIPVDVPQGAFEDYFPNSKIQKILNAVKARHIFLVADSCFSGTLFASYKSAAAADRLEKDPSRWGLTAGRNEVVADGKPGSHSPFADSLIYHLTNSQPPLGVAALCNKVIEDVIANANQTPRGEPLQVEGHRGGQFFFHPRHQIQGLFGASPKPAALPGLTVRQGNLLYSIPPLMQLGVPSRCEVRIAVDKEKLLENLENKENIEIRSIYVADEMEVELTTPFEEEDSPFKIKAITDRKQAIRDYTYTQWVFYVKPLRQGKFPLLLVVTVVENVDGKERVQDIVLEELVQVVAELPQDIEPGEGYKQARTFQLQPEVAGARGGSATDEFKDVKIGGSKSIESGGGDFPEALPADEFDVDFGGKKTSGGMPMQPSSTKSFEPATAPFQPSPSLPASPPAAPPGRATGGGKMDFPKMEQATSPAAPTPAAPKKSHTVSRALMGLAGLLAVVLAAVLVLPNLSNRGETEGLAGGSKGVDEHETGAARPADMPAPSFNNPEFALQSFLEQGCNALLHTHDPAAAIAYFEEAESIIEAAGLDERLKDLPVLQLARRAKKEGTEGDFPMEDFYWEAARQKDLPTGYLAYLQKFPDGKYAGEARKKLGQ